jgi:peptidyl-prolyl cis-trans isomerase A (cyclophilin A)
MRILLFLLFPAALHAQIYADFTVSSGGSPLGTFRVLLEHEKAPRTCANFIGLASGKKPWIDVTNGAVRTNTPYYDGLTFHRLIHSFVIQGGSPNGQGNDGPGYTILDEYHPDLRHSSDYVLSMAKSAFPNTGGSQFFITLRDTPELDDKHSVFGKVISGTAIIDGFKNPALFPTGGGDKPVTPIIIDSVVISGPSYAGFDLNAASLRLPHVFDTPYTAERDAVAKTFGIRFKLSAKANHFILASTDLESWFAPQHLLSVAENTDFNFTFTAVEVPRAFLRLTTTSYGETPIAPQSLGGIRIHQSSVHHIDLTFNGSAGTWTSSDGGSGTLGNISYASDAPASGFLQHNNLEADRLPLGNLSLTFTPAAGPEAWTSLNTYLSFHTESSGWLEEKSGSARRRPFEILSN